MNGKPSSAEVRTLTMTADEARQTVDQIKGHMESARKLIYDLHQRQGHKALGYGSWRECVTVEFGRSESMLYKELQAAEVEVALLDHGPKDIGSIPERTLRPLAPLRDKPAELRQAWDLANERTDGQPTGRAVQEAVDEVIARRPPLPGQRDMFTEAAEPEPEPEEEDTEEEAAEDDEPEEEEDFGPPAPPPPTKSEAEIAAERWIEHLHKLTDFVNLIVVSIPRRGGFDNLTRRWPKQSVVAAVTHMKCLRDQLDEGIRKLEGENR